MLQTIPALSQVLVLVLGGWLVINDRITLGTFLAFASYLVQLVAPSRMLAGLLALAQQARAGGERVLELLDSTSEVTDRPGAEPLAAVRGEVSFDGVTFGYLRSEPVLDGLLAAPRPRRAGGGGGHVRLGQVDPRAAAAPLLRRAGGAGHARRRWTCATSRSSRCVGRSAWCSRRASCSATPSGPTSPTAAPTRAPTTSSGRRERPPPTTSSSSCPTATTRWSASAASPSRAGSGSASRWPARCSPIPGCSCSTTPPRRSTPPPRRRSSRRSRRSSRAGRRCSSPIAGRRCGWPTGSSSSTAAGSWPRAPTRSCSAARRSTGRCWPVRTTRSVEEQEDDDQDWAGVTTSAWRVPDQPVGAGAGPGGQRPGGPGGTRARRRRHGAQRHARAARPARAAAARRTTTTGWTSRPRRPTTAPAGSGWPASSGRTGCRSASASGSSCSTPSSPWPVRSWSAAASTRASRTPRSPTCSRSRRRSRSPRSSTGW